MGEKTVRLIQNQISANNVKLLQVTNDFLLSWYINKHVDISASGAVVPTSVPEQYQSECNTELQARINNARRIAEHIYGIQTLSNEEFENLNNLWAKHTDAFSEENVGYLSATVAQLTDKIYSYVNESVYLTKRLQQAQNSKDNEHEDNTKREHVPVPEQSDHIYPVKLVAQTTNKLIDYNNQLESFIKQVRGYESRLRKAMKKGPGKINLNWIAKIVEKFCKRINYWLAMLRYQLIRALSGIYQKFNEAIQPIRSLYNAVMALKNLSIEDIPTALTDAATEMGKTINKPMAEFIQFIVDVATHTPPLIEEGTDLVVQVADATEYGTSLAEEIHRVIQDTLNAGLDPEIIARLAQKYIHLGDIDFSIHFEPFTLQDLINGTPVKPKWEDFA